MKTINSILLLVGTGLVCNVQGAAKTLTGTGVIALFEGRIDSKGDRSLGMMLGGKYMGAINLTTLYFLNVFFTKQDQKRLSSLTQNGKLVIPQGVNTIVSIEPGEYNSIEIPPTVDSINKGAFNGSKIEKISVWSETLKQLNRNGLNIYNCISPETEIVVVDGLEIQNEIPELPNPPTEPKPNMISKSDSFSEAIAKQRGKLRKTKGPQKAVQTEKSLQDQINSQKGKLKKAETQKSDPKNFYVSPLNQEIQNFDLTKLKHLEIVDEIDKSKAPKQSNPTETNSVMNEASKNPFLNDNNAPNSTEIERPRNPFLNDINNFNSRNLKHVDQQEIRKGKISHPHANFLANRRKAMREDEDLDENSSQEEDDYDNWDD